MYCKGTNHAVKHVVRTWETCTRKHVLRETTWAPRRVFLPGRNVRKTLLSAPRALVLSKGALIKPEGDVGRFIRASRANHSGRP
jgi:hypothetical protein